MRSFLICLIFLYSHQGFSTDATYVSFLNEARELFKNKPQGFQCLGRLENSFHLFKRREEVSPILFDIQKNALSRAKETQESFLKTIDSNEIDSKTLKTFLIFNEQYISTLGSLIQQANLIWDEAEEKGTDSAYLEAEKKAFDLNIPQEEEKLNALRQELNLDNRLFGHKIDSDPNGLGFVLKTKKRGLSISTTISKGNNEEMVVSSVPSPDSYSEFLSLSSKNPNQSSCKSKFETRQDGAANIVLVNVNSTIHFNKSTIFRFLNLEDHYKNPNYLDQVINLFKVENDFESFYLSLEELSSNLSEFDSIDCSEYLMKNRKKIINTNQNNTTYEVEHKFESTPKETQSK